jgi:glycosyltransferase involved in cell wall biosynthesis
MVVGLPSIVTQNGGASEILGQSQSGILIDPLQSKSILSAMQHLLGLRKEERQAMSESAQKEAKRFSTEHYIDSLMSIYTFSDFRLKPSAF